MTATETESNAGEVVTDRRSSISEGLEDPELTKKKEAKLRRERCQKWVLLAVATALVLTTITVILYFGINNPGPLPDDENTGEYGGLPVTCTLLQDTALSTVDPRIYFNVSTLLDEVAPPQRTGSLRDVGALPTGDFACNQINHGPLAPIRQFPPSALITDDGITYDAFTLDRWNHTDRQDPFYQLTPGRAGAPWEKVVSLGTNMKQIASGPDGAPLAAFTGSSGVRLGIVNTGEPVLTDFGEMYANFLYTDKDGGTMELPIVRGSAMLTHIFTKANPMMWPYCLVAVNGQSVRYECPEERSVADRGSGYVRASCSYVTMELILEIHFTKAITNIADVQWAATEESRWSTGRVMHTYNSTVCNMGSTGHIVTVNAARRQRDRLLRDPETRLWERLLGHHTSAGRLYGAWRPSEPVVGYKATVLVLRKCRCQRDVQSGQTGYNHRESQSSGRWIGRDPIYPGENELVGWFTSLGDVLII